MDQATAAQYLSDRITLARNASYGPEVRHVAVWIGESFSTYVWPLATVDNRRSRVLARIERFGMERPVRLVIFRVTPQGVTA